MDVPKRYWQGFADLVRDARYINLYQARTEAIDWRISVFSAVSSSAAIGGWAIWKELSFAWALIIALSQVLQAVKEYLPYKRRLKSLSGLSGELDSLAITAESDWFKICRGHLTEEEIHELHMKLKRKKMDLVKKHFGQSALPEHKKLSERACADAETYIKAYFGAGEDDEETEHAAEAAFQRLASASQHSGEGADAAGSTAETDQDARSNSPAA